MRDRAPAVVGDRDDAPPHEPAAEQEALDLGPRAVGLRERRADPREVLEQPPRALAGELRENAVGHSAFSTISTRCFVRSFVSPTFVSS